VRVPAYNKIYLLTEKLKPIFLMFYIMSFYPPGVTDVEAERQVVDGGFTNGSCSGLCVMMVLHMEPTWYASLAQCS
jgi:hypothetical protein